MVRDPLTNQREMSEGNDWDYGKEDGRNDEYLREDNRDDRGRWNSSNDDGQAPAQSNSDNIASLHISSLSFTSTEESLKATFEVFGPVESVTVIKDPVTKESRGYGFITFANAADSDKAVANLDGKEVDGRIIKVEKARRQRAYEKTPGQYLGNPKLSSKYRRPYDREFGGRDDRGYGARDNRGYGRDRPRDDRYPPRDNRGYNDAYRGGGNGGYERRGGYDDRGGYERGGYERFPDQRRGYPDDDRRGDYRRPERGYGPR